MKIRFCRLFKSYLPFLLLLIGSITGCTLSTMVRHSQQQKISIQPEILAVTGKNISFEVKSQIPGKVLRPNAIYALEFVYRYGTNEEIPAGRVAFKPGEFIYENKMPTIIRQFSLPYSPEKNQGKLWVQGVASTAKKREKRTSWQELAPGVITTSKLIAYNNQVDYAPDNLLAPADSVKTLTFFFEKGQAVLKSTFGSNLPLLDDFIQANYQIKTVAITASTSLEPEEFITPDLAHRRAQALKDYFKTKYINSTYTNSNDPLRFEPVSLLAPGELFRNKIKSTALSKIDLQQIDTFLPITTNQAITLEKLNKLESAEYLKQYVYPTLRFAEVKISFIPEQKRNYEIYLLSKNIIENKIEKEALTNQELRYAASLTPLLTEKQKIYETAVATSDEWQAYHDLGIVYLELARRESKTPAKNNLLTVAVKNLQFASHRQPTTENFYHLASAYQAAGNLNEANLSYDYALKAGGSTNLLQQVFADKVALEIEAGQIDAALRSLRYAGDSYQNAINRGLCYLLKENYDDAAIFYEEALLMKPDDALAHYCQAIIAARINDENLLGFHLQQAVRSDKAYIQKAIEDLEFRPYIRKAFFRSALI